MLRAFLIAATAAAVLAACGGSDPEPLAAPLAAETPGEGHTNRIMRAEIDMEVSGHTTRSVDGLPVKLKIVEILAGRNPVNIWFLSISPAEPVTLDDGRLMLFSADIAPGTYEGPGSYELSEAGGTTIEGVQSLGSGAYVQIYAVGDAPELVRYDRFGQPCTMEVAEELRTGTVTCPSLLDEEGNAVSLTWSWRLLTEEEI